MIYLLIPVFNEEDNIQELYKQIKLHFSEEDILCVLVDDGSSDNSVNTIKATFKDLRYQLLENGSNKGPGFSFNHGFTWILNQSNSDSDLVISFEADVTSDLSRANTMYSISKLGYDLVLASVYAQGGGLKNTSWVRVFVSLVANQLIRTIFDIKVNTLSSFYRVYRIDLLRKIQLKYGNITNEIGFICMVDILIRAIKVGATIIEVPVQLDSSLREGKSKMKLFKNTKDYLTYLLFRKS